MASVAMVDMSNKKVKDVELPAVFATTVKGHILHAAVVNQLANRRAGTAATKNKALVSGGGKKPFKQKGTGNARQGSIRAPHFSGGGVALGPKPRKYTQRTPKKMIKLALASALSDRVAEGKVVVVDSWSFEAPKTKDAKAALGALGIDGKALVVVDVDDKNTIKSFMNLPNVQLIERAELNAYDVLCADYVVFSKDTLPGGGEVTAAPAKKASAKKAAPAEKTKLVSADVPKGGEGSASDEPAASSSFPGSAPANEDGSAPEGYDIKGNASSMLYHVPGSAFYNRTVAEVWFTSAEDAEAAGFQLPPSQRKKDDES